MTENTKISSWEDYIPLAIRTESTNIANHVDPSQLQDTLTKIKDQCDLLDKMKKKIFYNRDVDGIDVKDSPDYTLYQKEQARIFHALLGIITESGELAEALLNTAEKGEMDMVNIKEELGDMFWYMAILFDSTSISGSDVMTTNINKLKKRYPEGFTEDAANNRDLETERKILEDKKVA